MRMIRLRDSVVAWVLKAMRLPAMRLPAMRLLAMILLAIILLFLKNITNPLAMMVDSAEETTAFTVRAVLPENQKDSTQTFFNLQMESGQEQTIEVEISNFSNQTIRIRTGIYTAITNDHGQVVYRHRPEQADDSLRFSLEELVTVEEIVEIPGMTIYRLPLQIQMPIEDINGILAGGLLFQEVTERLDAQVGEVSVVISYVLALLLNQGISSQPDLMLREVAMDITGEQTSVRANLQNIHPAFANQLSINTQITKVETGATILWEEREGMQMAPNSNFVFTVYGSASLFQGGEEYRIAYSITSGNHSWEFQEYIMAEMPDYTEGIDDEAGEAGEAGEIPPRPAQEQDQSEDLGGSALQFVVGLIGGIILGAGSVLAYMQIQKRLQVRDAKVDEIQKRFIADSIERE